MNIIEVESEGTTWDQFVASTPEATFYHQFAWKDIITDSFGHNCHYLVAIDAKGVWQGLLPLVHMRSRLFGNFLVSVPFVNYGGLLARNKEAKSHLLAEAERLRDSIDARYVELRHTENCVADMPARQHKVAMVLGLTDSIELQWQVFNAKVRNQVRKAEKSNLQPVSGHLELLDEFYQVFAHNMRDLGTPVYAKKFFYNVLKAFPESTTIVGVNYENRFIAAGLLAWHNNKMEIPWASSIRGFNALCPNNMLYWEALKLAIQKNLAQFDFGRSTPNEGAYKFKKQWGAKPVPLYWHYLMSQGTEIPKLDPSNPKYAAAIRIWQRLPVSITKVIGPPIVRNIP